MWPWKQPEDDLKTRVATLERSIRELQLEWASVADKLLHRIQRQAKRDRDALAASAEAQEPRTNGGEASGHPHPRDRASLWARVKARSHVSP